MPDIPHKVGIKSSSAGDVHTALFKHAGWRERVAFMHHRGTEWGVFPPSLKSLLETGQGTPWPNEIKLDIWE